MHAQSVIYHCDRHSTMSYLDLLIKRRHKMHQTYIIWIKCRTVCPVCLFSRWKVFSCFLINLFEPGYLSFVRLSVFPCFYIYLFQVELRARVIMDIPAATCNDSNSELKKYWISPKNVAVKWKITCDITGNVWENGTYEMFALRCVTFLISPRQINFVVMFISRAYRKIKI